mmetsp:Transcript_13806/g.34484  ORF Transcript_13806/g.34484 Transcript_13806/m.34484 type:complete len:430 (-) Transcript_13806:74-1363(-)
MFLRMLEGNQHLQAWRAVHHCPGAQAAHQVSVHGVLDVPPARRLVAATHHRVPIAPDQPQRPVDVAGRDGDAKLHAVVGIVPVDPASGVRAIDDIRVVANGRGHRLRVGVHGRWKQRLQAVEASPSVHVRVELAELMLALLIGVVVVVAGVHPLLHCPQLYVDDSVEVVVLNKVPRKVPPRQAVVLLAALVGAKHAPLQQVGERAGDVVHRRREVLHVAVLEDGLQCRMRDDVVCEDGATAPRSDLLDATVDLDRLHSKWHGGRVGLPAAIRVLHPVGVNVEHRAAEQLVHEHMALVGGGEVERLVWRELHEPLPPPRDHPLLRRGDRALRGVGQPDEHIPLRVPLAHSRKEAVGVPPRDVASQVGAAGVEVAWVQLRLRVRCDLTVRRRRSVASGRLEVEDGEAGEEEEGRDRRVGERAAARGGDRAA